MNDTDVDDDDTGLSEEDKAAIARSGVVDGSLLGAVGVSGDKADKDELCAVAGIASVGLVSDTGDPA